MSEKSNKAAETPIEGAFTKEQFLASAKYSYQDKDVLSALLEPEKLYTAFEAQQVIDDFKNKEVE